MPLFEFVCQSCGKQFEEIVRSSSIPRCPDCESTSLRKLISAFAVGSGGSRTSSPNACPPIGGG
jgi:putative FmdB family regulatory protein